MVVASTFPAFPPLHGGQRRIADVYAALAAAGADVTIVALTHGGSRALEVPSKGLRQIVVPRSEQQEAFDGSTAREAGIPVEDILADETPKLTPAYLRVLRDACIGADVVVASHPYLISSIDAVWSGPIVYDAIDDDAALKEAVLPPTRLGRLLATTAAEIEARCVRRAAFTFTISERIADALAERYQLDRSTIAAVPPIVDPASFVSPDVVQRVARRRAFSPVPVALFVGSGHPPNVDAARKLIAAAVTLSEVHLVVAGSCGGAIDRASLPPNVTVTGVLNDIDYRRVLGMADVVLNPVEVGGGVNIKMLDYVASGAPILSTRLGANGLAHLLDHIDVVQDGDWATAIRRTLAQPPEIREARALAAQRALAERHAAKAVAAPLLERIGALATGSQSRQLRGEMRPKLVIATHHTVHPVTGGGSRRMQQLYGIIGSQYDVVVCSRFEMPQQADEVELAPNVVERRSPRGAVQQSMFQNAVGQFGGAGGRDEVRFDETMWLNPVYADTLRRSLRGAAAAMCTHPYAYGALRSVWSGPIVYDSQNVEYISQLAVLTGAPNRSAMLQRVAEIERRCVREAAAVVAISEGDAELFVELYGVQRKKILVVPPAVDPDAIPYRDGEARQRLKATSSLAGRTVALFVGSNWPMNLHAALRLADVARAVPEVLFLVVGSVGGPATGALGDRRPENLQFTGVVDDATYGNILGLADLAVNPIEQGSGLCMKVMDYIGAGLPIVSTVIGARGWGIAPDEAKVGPVAQFPEFVRAVLTQREAAEGDAQRLYARLVKQRSRSAHTRPLLAMLDTLVGAQDERHEMSTV